MLKSDGRRGVVSSNRGSTSTGWRGRAAVSEKRRIIARRMSESISTAPHFYLTVVVNAGKIIEARTELNKHSANKVSLNAFLIKMVAEALRRHPLINSSWHGDTIIQHDTIDIGLAVAQKDGLIVPVVRNCFKKGIIAINGELTDLVQRAREGRLSVQEYTGGTFTISNLGSFGIRQFTAIINPPEAAILAVGEIFKELEPKQPEGYTVADLMYLTLSCDHRVIDGATGANFMKELMYYREPGYCFILDHYSFFIPGSVFDGEAYDLIWQLLVQARWVCGGYSGCSAKLKVVVIEKENWRCLS